MSKIYTAKEASFKRRIIQISADDTFYKVTFWIRKVRDLKN